MIPFSSIGFVAKVVTDRVSGYSKGFGFVRYATLEDSAKGIAGMDGKVLFILISISRLPYHNLLREIYTDNYQTANLLSVLLCSFLTVGSYSQSMQDRESNHSHINLRTTCLVLHTMVTARETVFFGSYESFIFIFMLHSILFYDRTVLCFVSCYYL